MLPFERRVAQSKPLGQSALSTAAPQRSWSWARDPTPSEVAYCARMTDRSALRQVVLKAQSTTRERQGSSKGGSGGGSFDVR